MRKIQALKGFRDFLPKEARKRQYIIRNLKSTFESWGFEPLETPALEYEELLAGKYGEEGEKLMYRFRDQGGRLVALRYDQTVPLARVVAEYPNLPKPFKRYQIQPVWRAENPQQGRYREFLQCDIDTVGSSSTLADAEIIACGLEAIKNLGLNNVLFKINDRKIFEGIKTEYLVALDKMPKIGKEKTVKELQKRGMSKQEAGNFLQKIQKLRPTSTLKKIFALLKKFGFSEGSDYIFDPTIIRGLDYYTGAIFELFEAQNPTLSLVAGGRYDNLIGMFAKNAVPAVGLSFGLDRIMNVMQQQGLFPQTIEKATAQVLVTIFSPQQTDDSIKTASQLRKAGIKTEIYSGNGAKLNKQLKYADRRLIPYVVIIGEEEAKDNLILLKNMMTGKQERVKLEEAIKKLTTAKESRT